MSEDIKPFWHEASEEEIISFMEAGATWEDVMQKYAQPKWCNYPKALEGALGCWSLTFPETRIKICSAYCKDCECFKQ